MLALALTAYNSPDQKFPGLLNRVLYINEDGIYQSHFPECEF